jgi:hypothetical protein
LFLASLVAAPVAAKDEQRPFNAGDYVAPFMMICLQHYGDPAAQLASAKAMHKQTKTDFWKLQNEAKVGVTTQLSFGGSTVSADEGGNQRCSFSARVDREVTLDEFGAGVSAAFGGVSPTKRVGPPPDIAWILKLPKSDNPLVVTASTSVEGERPIVTLSVQDF